MQPLLGKRSACRVRSWQAERLPYNFRVFFVCGFDFAHHKFSWAMRSQRLCRGRDHMDLLVRAQFELMQESDAFEPRLAKESHATRPGGD
jgi:hypothetical protein